MAGDFFSELEGLKGGKKQSWITNHLDLIWALNNEIGFTRTKELLHMTDRTLVAALQKAEKGDRPAVTNGRRALKRADYIENLAYSIAKRLGDLEGQFENQQQAVTAALGVIEKVLLVLRLALTGKMPVDISQVNFEGMPHNLYVTSSSRKNVTSPMGDVVLHNNLLGIPKRLTKGRGRRKTKGKRS